MKTLAILGSILGGLVIVLAGGSYLLIKPAAIAAAVAAQVEESTGYALLSGETPEVALWPEPSVTLRKVSLAEPKSAGGVASLSAERLVIVTGFRELFSGTFAPQSIEAQGAKLNLLIDAKGAANWPRTLGKLPQPLKVTEGSIAFLDERSGSTFTASGLNATVAQQVAGEEIKSFGEFVWHKQPVRFSIEIKSLPRVMEDGSPTSITINGPVVDFFFDGRMGLAEGLALAGQFSVNSHNFRSLSRWLGYDVRDGYGLAAVELSGALDSRGNQASVSRAILSLDETSASGTLGFDFSGKVPRFTGNLTADQIDLATYLGEPRKPSPEWSTEPIDFKSLMAFDTAIDISFDVATYGDLDFHDLRTRIRQSGGTFAAMISEMIVANGKGSARVQLDGTAAVPAVEVTFEATDVDTQVFLRNLFGIGSIKGSSTVSASLRSSGKTQTEMISTLNGSASFAIGEGSFDKVDPGALLKQVSTQIVEGWLSEGSAEFRDLQASFGFVDGVAQISSMSLADDVLSMTVSGEADILRRAVDLKVAPKLVDSNGNVSWPVQVAINGPWEKPKMFPDIADLPSNPAAGFQKLKTMGLPVLPAPAPAQN